MEKYIYQKTLKLLGNKGIKFTTEDLGNLMSSVGSKLNYMAYPLIGSKDSYLIEKTLNQLWNLDLNRFSHKYEFEAKLNNKTVGMITCYPVSLMDKLALPTL